MNKKKQNLAERQKKLVQTCIRKTLAFSINTGQQLQVRAQQFLGVPRAIADADGIPCKGVKANTTKVLERRYSGIIVAFIPPPRHPDVIVLDGMVILNSSPLKIASTRTFQHYIRFLVHRWIMPYLKVPATVELHIVLDDPDRNGLSPKTIERQRRDSNRNFRSSDVIPVEDDIAFPPNWQTFLSNRLQKRLLVNYTSLKLLEADMSRHLRTNQKLVVVGGFDGENRDKAYSIRRGQSTEREPTLDSNHEESDSRVWLHAFGSKGQKILIYSPDTDTYHVGPPLLERYSNTEVTVQLAPSTTVELFSQSRFLLLNNLRQALHEDPDLADIERPALTSVLQTVFVATGCDYVSFFARIGKATFFIPCFKMLHLSQGLRWQIMAPLLTKNITSP